MQRVKRRNGLNYTGRLSFSFVGFLSYFYLIFFQHPQRPTALVYESAGLRFPGTQRHGYDEGESDAFFSPLRFPSMASVGSKKRRKYIYKYKLWKIQILTRTYIYVYMGMCGTNLPIFIIFYQFVIIYGVTFWDRLCRHYIL